MEELQIEGKKASDSMKMDMKLEFDQIRIDFE
jgi:hypothetical protein